MFILQLWAWEHLPMFAPQDPREFWGPDEELCALANPRYGVNYQVTWDPYPPQVIEIHRLRHPQDVQTWLCKVPLICWHMVEWHLPDRALRQYRMEQPIPASPPQGFKELHAIDLHHKSKNWIRKHEFYINIWENRATWAVQGLLETRPMGYHDGTWCGIQNSHLDGYQSKVLCVERWLMAWNMPSTLSRVLLSWTSGRHLSYGGFSITCSGVRESKGGMSSYTLQCLIRLDLLSLMMPPLCPS
ncbi:unnamed protein product [Linum trigynum]|uniref:Aminotransferase-like plant mobile domain-containing protein n=1 Tax=Linum trigynum TaxID=586398 RepID=A0AAV2FXP9_9ROSI